MDELFPGRRLVQFTRQIPWTQVGTRKAGTIVLVGTLDLSCHPVVEEGIVEARAGLRIWVAARRVRVILRSARIIWRAGCDQLVWL